MRVIRDDLKSHGSVRDRMQGLSLWLMLLGLSATAFADAGKHYRQTLHKMLYNI